MKSHEISLKLEEKKSKRGYLCYSANLKVKPLFRDCTCTEADLGHYQTCMIELFCRKYLTAAKASSSVLIAILTMFFFVGMNLLEGIVTGMANNYQNI